MSRPGDLRAFRWLVAAMLGWWILSRELVARSKITKKTIADFERGATEPRDRTLAQIKAAFDTAGSSSSTAATQVSEEQRAPGERQVG